MHRYWSALVTLALGGAAAAAQPAAPAGTVSVRVYEGFATLGPLYGSRQSPLAVDVKAQLARCPDGNASISALDIGGWRYQVGNPCSADAARAIVVTLPGQSIKPKTRVIAATRAAGPKGPLRCDPNTWRCRAAP